MKTTSRVVSACAVLLVAAGLLGGCVYPAPAPGYGYYGPPPATVVVGGGWGWGHGGWGGGWRR